MEAERHHERIEDKQTLEPAMRTLPGFRIYGPPRTKKTHGRIVTLTPKGQKREYCHQCKRQFGRQIILPSDQYTTWEGEALAQMPLIRSKLAAAGVSLPVVGLVSIEARIYREANIGDTAGFIQAIGDMLQRAGILENDVQIEDWDGTRRLKDATNPRVEIFITVLEERAVQESLPIGR